MKQVYILSAVRTPIGSFGGSLSSLTAPHLGAIAIREAVARAAVDPQLVQEVLMGNVLSAGLGQAPATQAAKFAGLPDLPATTVNKVCASGMKAVMLAAQAIALEPGSVRIAGGMESMSNAPYYLEKARTGYRLGHGQLIDSLLKDGLWDVYNDYHMGSAAELCAAECGISRADQDEFAITSYRRSQDAQARGLFDKEIIAVELKDKKGNVTLFEKDEETSAVNFEKIPSLKPVFAGDGTVTAANASTLNDGAAALVLAGEDAVRQHGFKPLARICGYADAQQLPEWFTTAPSKAIPKAILNAGLTPADISFYEINEAFSVVSIANNRALELDPARVNVNGGAVSMGHPLGASGARILVTLLHVLQQNNARYGVAGICNGGGGASAIVIENLSAS
ncbi:acetyl-CoA C-acyltransferase [Hufsiella ginkgonis]|uniref:acetyl-CoA C-acetyltransferase n=1 Tax=Hufsiella ginkgonis TaxID=2695274 RepID=A0A7K1XXV3_9SPHI|nr:acetyl-CoA C-acyltransferase [Hufsiella ginkgonis]MXV15667.1 acetyl-CoA C-acyltransferase [Hufsiella ginkgonis]